MAIAPGPTLDLQRFADAIRAGANAQFTSPQFRRLFDVPLTIERARVYTLQKSHWIINRRDCWGLAMGLAPMDVKKLIWLHEQDARRKRRPWDRGPLPLAGSRRRGARTDGR